MSSCRCSLTDGLVAVYLKLAQVGCSLSDESGLNENKAKWANKLRPYNVTSTNFGFRSSSFFGLVRLHFFGISRLHFLG